MDVRIDEIVLRALEKAPELRYQTAVEFRTQVETLISAPPPDKTAPRAAGHARPRVRAWLLAAGVALVIGLVIALVTSFYLDRAKQQKSDSHSSQLIQEEIIRLAQERVDQVRARYKMGEVPVEVVVEAEGALALAKAHGDPLKQAQVRLDTATRALEILDARYKAGEVSYDEITRAKQRKLEAERDLDRVRPGASPQPGPGTPDQPQVAAGGGNSAGDLAVVKPLTSVVDSPQPRPDSTPAKLPLSSISTGPRAISPEKASVEKPFVNSLGIQFVPVPDTKVLFAIWDVRVQDFAVFAEAVHFPSQSWRSVGFKQGPDHPVVKVSWEDAVAFCQWLTDKEHTDKTLPENCRYRLPTDLEWSTAAGLPKESKPTPAARDMDVPDVFSWGTQWPPPPGAGNYAGEETGSDLAIKGYNDGYRWTSPVGAFPANRFGLFDMGGNVWQWCQDSWMVGSLSKALRGGSWYMANRPSLLSSCRVSSPLGASTDNYGFRCVVTLGPDE